MPIEDGLLYFEDMTPGTVFDLGTYPPVSETEIIDFARQWDPQYFHVDPEAAKESLFGGLIASGWHTGAIAMHLLVNALLVKSASQGSPGLENVRFLRPVRPGDELSGTYEVLAAEPSQSRPEIGKTRNRMQLINQHGDVVLSVDSWGFWRRRPQPDGA